MSLERTYAMIKPDAVAAGNSGKIIDLIEKHGFRIVAMKKLKMTKEQGEAFYAVHKERPFFNGLVTFMTEGPIVALVMEREDAVKQWRDLMGATNPANAAEGTIRKLYATSIERNAAHGSDAPETAAEETRFFFCSSELL